eukprot:1178923-Prorocentrum_minimum.AAC.2
MSHSQGHPFTWSVEMMRVVWWMVAASRGRGRRRSTPPPRARRCPRLTRSRASSSGAPPSRPTGARADCSADRTAGADSWQNRSPSWQNRSPSWQNRSPSWQSRSPSRQNQSPSWQNQSWILKIGRWRPRRSRLIMGGHRARRGHRGGLEGV